MAPSAHPLEAAQPRDSSDNTTSTRAPSQDLAQMNLSEEAQAEELIFLGTGTSGCVPVIGCLTVEKPDCPTCTSPLKENKRLNTSCLIRVKPPGSSSSPPEYKNLLIDCGKTFFTTALSLFPAHNLRRIDALLLTHAHADAFFGLDDLRSWTLPGPKNVQPHVDIYCSAETMREVTRTFPYLVDKSKATGGGDVPSFVWHVFDEGKSFNVETCGNVKVTPLPIGHGMYLDSGKPFMSLGFRVGGFSYISDCSGVPDTTREAMRGSRVVVMDGLKWDPHSSHFSIPQAREFVRDELGTGVRANNQDSTKTNGNGHEEKDWEEELGPQSTWLTGFSHAVEHTSATEEFTRWGEGEGKGMWVRPAWDGLRIGKDGRPLPGS